MFETLSVKEALRNGNRILKIPSGLFYLAGTIISLILVLTNYSESLELNFLIGILVSIAVDFFYKIVIRPKWKIWAFDNVRNVHELKRKAIKQGIIAKDKDLISGFEIWMKSDKIKWSEILVKFNIEDEYSDDFSVTDETEIFYTKKIKILEIFSILGCFCVGIYLINNTELVFGGIISIIFSFVFLTNRYRILSNKNPQIILNHKGIKTSTNDFVNWSELKNAEIDFDKNDNEKRLYLKLEYLDETNKTFIDELDTDADELEDLIQVYKFRSKRNDYR